MLSWIKARKEQIVAGLNWILRVLEKTTKVIRWILKTILYADQEWHG